MIGKLQGKLKHTQSRKNQPKWPVVPPKMNTNWSQIRCTVPACYLDARTTQGRDRDAHQTDSLTSQIKRALRTRRKLGSFLQQVVVQFSHCVACAWCRISCLMWLVESSWKFCRVYGKTIKKMDGTSIKVSCCCRPAVICTTQWIVLRFSVMIWYIW